MLKKLAIFLTVIACQQKKEAAKDAANQSATPAPGQTLSTALPASSASKCIKAPSFPKWALPRRLNAEKNNELLHVSLDWDAAIQSNVCEVACGAGWKMPLREQWEAEKAQVRNGIAGDSSSSSPYHYMPMMSTLFWTSTADTSSEYNAFAGDLNEKEGKTSTSIGKKFDLLILCRLGP